LDDLRETGRFFFVNAMDDGMSSSGVNKTEGDCRVKSNVLAPVIKGLATVLMSLPSSQTNVLILDSPDVLLGMYNCNTYDVLSSLTDLRRAAQGMVMIMASDVSGSMEIAGNSDNLQSSHQQFLLTTTHQSTAVLSTRVLDTGQAKDVSGVLRINSQGTMCRSQLWDVELLYHLEPSRAVRIWQRGTGV
jgi:elongator complex protein 6